MSGLEDREVLLVEDLAKAESCWTCDRRTIAGDRLYIYCRAPVSCIFAQGIAAGPPFILDDPGSEWNGSWMVMIEKLELCSSISMQTLRAVFPEWRRLWYFVGRAKLVPGHIEDLLQKLVHEDFGT